MQASLRQQALQLSAEERLELMDALWESIVANPESLPVTDAQRAELDRRLEDLAVNPKAEVPWNEVRAGMNPRR